MKRRVLPTLMVVLLLLVPLMVSSPFYLDLLVQIMVASLIASSLNLLLGIGGLFSFAQTALAGSVSYTVALGCVRYGVSPWLAASGAIGIGLVISLAIGALALLPRLNFDFNPLDLMDPHTEAVSTMMQLMKDPNTTTNTIDILELPPLRRSMRPAELSLRLYR